MSFDRRGPTPNVFSLRSGDVGRLMTTWLCDAGFGALPRTVFFDVFRGAEASRVITEP